MAKLEDHLRSFGMSALLISDEISQIEAAYSVNLQDRGKSSAEDPRGYYGQFDKSNSFASIGDGGALRTILLS